MHYTGVYYRGPSTVFESLVQCPKHDDVQRGKLHVVVHAVRIIIRYKLAR